MKKWTRWLGLIALSVMLLVMGGLYTVGDSLSAPAPRLVGPAPSDLHAQNVSFAGLRGWFVPAGNNENCVVLMHGIRSDRRGMLARARFLQKAGFASLLFDFQSHGESPGRRISFGVREAGNAQAAVDTLRQRFRCQRIAAIGQSLGGAAALLGAAPLPVDALILESVYPTIEEAIASRLEERFGPVGRLLEPFLSLQLKPVVGVSAAQLRPIEHIGEVREPVLVLAGTKDPYTPLDASQRLFAAAPQPKEFWWIEGAGHVDLEAFAPTEYQVRVLSFLERWLKRPGVATLAPSR